MKKTALLLLVSILLISCSSDSNQTDTTTPPATEKLLIVSNTNIPINQGELLVFVNGAAQSGQISRMVKVNDVVRIQSGSTAPPSTSYYISVVLGSKQIVDHYTSGQGEQMNWLHTITTEDFQ
jgi:hypothetical protein